MDHSSIGTPSGSKLPSDCLLANSFRYYFTGSLTLLFTFPSRYSFTIGHNVYLALECGHPRFLPEFAVSESTQESPRSNLGFVYTAFTFFGQVFHPVLLPQLVPYWSPTTPTRRWVWALSFSLVAYSGNLVRFLFLWVLRYFSSPGLPLSQKNARDPVK